MCVLLTCIIKCRKAATSRQRDFDAGCKFDASRKESRGLEVYGNREGEREERNPNKVGWREGGGERGGERRDPIKFQREINCLSPLNDHGHTILTGLSPTFAHFCV